MTSHIDYKPAKPVGVRFTIVESDRRPHLVEAGSLEKLFRVERVVPFGEVVNAEIQGAVCCGVKSGRNPFLVLQLAVHQSIPGSTVRYDVRLADNSGRRHPQRLEYAILQKVAVELSGHPAD